MGDISDITISTISSDGDRFGVRTHSLAAPWIAQPTIVAIISGGIALPEACFSRPSRIILRSTSRAASYSAGRPSLPIGSRMSPRVPGALETFRSYVEAMASNGRTHPSCRRLLV